jgi:hypothetical protein
MGALTVGEIVGGICIWRFGRVCIEIGYVADFIN